MSGPCRTYAATIAIRAYLEKSQMSIPTAATSGRILIVLRLPAPTVLKLE